MDKKPDFIVQAGLLDRLIKLNDPNDDPVGVNIVLKKIKENPDLRRYFFSQSPPYWWANLLFKHEFFSTPPNIIVGDDGSQAPYWDASAYLSSVADQVPEVVTDVISQIETDNPIIHADLTEAIMNLPSNSIVSFVPKIKKWIAADNFGWRLPEQVARLIKMLSNKEDSEYALDLLEELLRPQRRRLTEHGITWPAEFKFSNSIVKNTVWEDLVPNLSRINTTKSVEVIERTLLLALALEYSDSEEVDWQRIGGQFWRPEIAKNEVYPERDYKDEILGALRDILVEWDEIAPENELKQKLENYLNSSIVILKRVALFVIKEKGGVYRDLVADILTSNQNYSDLHIHTEFFQLLNKSYSLLDNVQKSLVISIINLGPSEEDKAYWWEMEQKNSNKVGWEGYAEEREKAWIRDRLWMIRDQIPRKEKDLLNKLIQELGEPNKPERIVGPVHAYFVSYQSPLGLEELSKMPPEEIFEFFRNWKEDPYQSGPNQVTAEGAADVLATLLLSENSNAIELIPRCDFLAPIFSTKLFYKAHETWKNKKEIPWEALLKLAMKLGEQAQGNSSNEDIWVGARLAASHLISSGLYPGNLVSVEFFGLLLRTILIFLDDPNPSEADDNPREGYFGHNDPITQSLNTVRPIALSNLFDLVALKQSSANNLNEKSIDSLITGDAFLGLLEKRLDRAQEKSRTLHSVFGQYVWLLHASYSSWFERNVKRIFPPHNEDGDQSYFIAAWDAYLYRNLPSQELFLKLKHFYARGVTNYLTGKRSETHLGLRGQLCGHLVNNYLLNPYPLSRDLGEENLIGLYFSLANSEQRGSFIAVLVQVYRSMEPRDRTTYWAPVNKIWLWRLREASVADTPAEFEKEAAFFSELPSLAPESETIVSLWPMLENLLEFSDDYQVWKELEDYIVTSISNFPEKSLELYRLMHSARSQGWPNWRHRETADIILGQGVENLRTRRDALAIMDILYRSGISKYRDLYNRYT